MTHAVDLTISILYLIISLFGRDQLISGRKIWSTGMRSVSLRNRPVWLGTWWFVPAVCSSRWTKSSPACRHAASPWQQTPALASQTYTPSWQYLGDADSGEKHKRHQVYTGSRIVREELRKDTDTFASEALKQSVACTWSITQYTVQATDCFSLLKHVMTWFCFVLSLMDSGHYL